MAGRTEPNQTLKARLALLQDELTLALRWDSSCILIAVTRSEITRRKVATMLRRAIEKQGSHIRTMAITAENADIALTLRAHPEWTDGVIYIHGLRWGGGRGGRYAYHALNMHREYLVEGRIRCVFWVSEHESRQIPRLAPDFWAFRHKVVDFPELPSLPRMGKDRRETIRTLTRLEQAVRNDPGSTRKLLVLGRYLRDLGCLEEALKHYQKALRLAGRPKPYAVELAALYRTIGQENLAQQVLKKAVVQT